MKLKCPNRDEIKNDIMKTIKQKSKKIFEKQIEKLQNLSTVLGSVEQNRQFNDLNTNINKKQIKFEDCLLLPVNETMEVRLTEQLLQDSKVNYDYEGLPCQHTLTALDLTQTITWYHSKDKPFCLKLS